MTRPFAAAVLLAVTLLSAPRAALAQSAADRSHAVELKKQGDALVHDLHYREALALYDEAFAISHEPAILYNRGRALDALGETPQALDAFEEFIRLAPADLKAKVPQLDELLASVRARVATVVVRCPVAGASVIVRRKLEGTTPLVGPLRVPTGVASIEVQAAGYQPFHVELDLGAGAPTTVDVALVKEAGPTPPLADVPPVGDTPVPPVDSHEKEKPGGGGWKWAAYSTGVLGIAGIASGATFGALAASKQSGADAHCPARACDPTGSGMIADARTFATVSTISFIVGGVGLATSVLFFLWKPGHAGAQARVFPVVGPAFGGLGGTF